MERIMANEEQLSILKQGVEVWNAWRAQNDDANIDLSSADLNGFHLNTANLKKVNLKTAKLMETHLEQANLSQANLRRTNFSNSHLRGANFREANLLGANLSAADLRGVNLSASNLRYADLRDADLSGADLRTAFLVQANIDGAKISGGFVYAVNVWDLEGEFEEQKDLVISPPFAQVVTVDNIKVSQFLYLIMNNQEIRDVINTLTSKSVLILGRFALSERKEILDALRNKLREYNLLPIVFDFDRPVNKDLTETIKTLAGLSYFVIADITNPKSSPLELQATVPDYQIPFVPIIQEGESPFAMMVDLRRNMTGSCQHGPIVQRRAD
jgi:hypothetical protein